MQRRTVILWSAGGLAAAAVAVGIFLDPSGVWGGLKEIVTSPDILITDYIAVGGLGAALVNMGLVVLAAVALIRLSDDPCHGFTIAELGLMAGFSLFGKNIVNIWPIILGTFLYARFRKEPFHRYLAVALLTTSLAPLVSWLMFGSVYHHVLLGFGAGIVIGFFMPVISAYTFEILHGMSLYNIGFSCGLVAMLVVPILAALNDRPETVLFWSTEYSTLLAIVLVVLCVGAIAAGILFDGWRRATIGWRAILRTSGRALMDYLRDYGVGATLINMGVNGLLGVSYIWIIGGDFSGPVVGGILTMIAFSASGKHLLNCTPILIGVGLGALLLHQEPTMPSLQIAALFGTTLAPVAGTYGWIAGIIAGGLHSALVLETGGPVAGMNLYNNGFSAGVIALVLHPVLSAIHRHRLARMEEAYLDALEGLNTAEENEDDEDE